MISTAPTEVLYLTVLFVFGVCFGSFINVVNYRLPKMLQQQWRAESQAYLNLAGSENNLQQTFSLLKPRSCCTQCHAPISVWQNIPIISFLWLKARCAHCNGAISWKYPLIELIGGCITLGMAMQYGLNMHMAGAAILCLSLLTLACIDIQYQLLPDVITLPLLWVGLMFNLNQTFVALGQAVLGAILGYSVLWAFAKIFHQITGKHGMAHGDMKLLAALGAWLGWQMLPQILVIASFSGSLVGWLWLMRTKQAYATPIPFGPFLAAAGVIVLLWGPTMNNTFLHLLHV